MDDRYEVVSKDGEVIYSEPTGDYSSHSFKSVMTYAIGWAYGGHPTTVRRMDGDKLIFSFTMTDVMWRQ